MELNKGISPIAFVKTQTRVSAIKFGDFGGVYLHVYPQYELIVSRLQIIENCLKTIFRYYLIPE